MKKLQVPYNLDLNIISIYQNYEDYISEVYFAAPPSIFPTAREFGVDEDSYLKDCCYLCREMNKVNINTMLLLNGTSVVFNNDVFSKLYGLLSVLSLNGLTGIVIANPILGEWAHATFPNLKIRLSVLSHIDSLEKIKQIESLGYINGVCLPQDFNRNLETLKVIRKNTKLQLSAIVNSACRINCPLWGWHHNIFNSNGNLREENFQLIAHSYSEQTAQFNNNILCAPWLLPSELFYYDEFYNGYKIEDRTSSTEDLIRYIKYYSYRVNPDSLKEILHASCLKGNYDIKIAKIPLSWRHYIQTCRGECWNCDQCASIQKQLKEE